MNILLLGANGQVGWELRRALAPLGALTALDRSGANFERPDSLAEVVARHRPDAIVNAAAYTAVDRAEGDVARARCVNAEAPAVLAAAAARLGAWLVHYSTDYVFDGNKPAPYVETDPTDPASVYGATKLEGERAIAASACRHLILRTSWVFAARGANFAKTMLRLARERDELKVVADQIGAPTGAEFIADATALMLYRLAHDAGLAADASGIYHLSGGGAVSWYDYARFVIERARAAGAPIKVEPARVLPIATADYPTPARRPANSRLDCSKIGSIFGIYAPAWETQVARLVDELVAPL
ncbi:MAG: dTDP-4-dehydrorhamnose reductase [Rhodocyclaceae bacterium]|nr:dTDP-4-dehydrorhamnose reductase [Rhodocyclaceae bacterium]